MAHSLLDLSHLIAFQLKRLKLDELIYKDELQLQRQLYDLDISPCSQQRHCYKKNISDKFIKKQQQHQALQVPETSQTVLITSSCSSSSPLELSTNKNISNDNPNILSCAHFSNQCNIQINQNQNQSAKMNGEIILLNDEKLNTNNDDNITRTLSSTDSEDDAHPIDKQKEFRSLVLEWLQQLRVRTENFKSDEDSCLMRESANDSYRREQHSLKACDLYTEAIFLAPSRDSIAAAMAHANRSTVLHDCGLYEQSYDDCLCALDLGYPEEYQPLIKLRQASCALKLRNFELCEQHLHELLHMELSETLEARTHELWHECELSKSEKIEMGVQTDSDLLNNGTKLYDLVSSDNTNLLTTTNTYLRSNVHIPNNTIVLYEEAAVFVPSGETRICDHCGITQFIPFPCIFCSNRNAVYCSRKCRTAHASIHSLECFAHQIELFEEFNGEFSQPRLLQLAFRMLINGMPQIVPHCRKKSTISKMWSAFNISINERNNSTTSTTTLTGISSTSYATLFKLEPYLDKEEKQSMITFAIAAQILAIYLGEYTDFFDLLGLTMPAVNKLLRQEWELLTSALLLRHICQLRHKHLIHCPSFAFPADPHILSTNDEFRIWQTVRHVQRGYLHLLAGHITIVAYAVFPHTLSQCRHSCVDLLHCKISGAKLTAYSTTDIPINSIIHNCFLSWNYRQSLYERRKNELGIRGINCNCEKCHRLYPDEDFHKFHRYRCDNPNCKQIFTPANLKHSYNLRWWKSFEQRSAISNSKDEKILICDVCKQYQKLEWFWTFCKVLSDCDAVEERCKLYAAIERADFHLVDMHEFKVALARQLLEQCLFIHRGSVPLDEWELNKLGSIMRNCLPIVAAQYRVFSLEYVQHMSYFWDVMALSNYKCSDKELMQMLQALEYIPDEFKEIFINYYEDYIATKFLDNTYGSTVFDTKV